MSGSVGTTSQRSGKRGSTFSDKQIAKTVRDGKAIEFSLVDGVSLTGWVYGMDDFHWGVVDGGGRTHLVHKAAATRVSILDSEGAPPAVVTEVAGRFRDYVMKTYFGQQSQQPIASR